MTAVRHTTWTWPLLLTLAACGCGGEPAQRPAGDAAPAPPASPSGGEDEPAPAPGEPWTKEFDGIRFTAPADWKDVELQDFQRGFVDGRILIPTRAGELQLTFTSTSASPTENVRRWIGQFQLPPGDEPQRETVTVEGVEGTWIDLRGRYDSGLPAGGGAQDDWRMIGVALPLGPQTFCLALRGPRAGVREAADDFREFVESAELTD